MIVKKLRLRNFRNYENAEIDLGQGMNLIYGKNAQGKTNLLESLVYLSLTRSHRISDDRRLIKEGAPFADIQCIFEDDIEKEIEAVIHPKGKTLLIRKQPVKRSSEFVGLLNVVLFAPDDLSIFNDAPRERRRIMNQEITKVSPRYLLALNQYQNYLKERNVILKSSSSDQTLLDTLDEQMARAQVSILKSRKNFVEQIGKEMPGLYQEMSDEKDEVRLKYSCCIPDLDADDEAVYKSLMDMYRASRKKDLDYHVTSEGCHHEDMLFEMNGSSLINTASQGQKRMTMLAFKIASLKYIEAETGKRPVLLLDDVLSELDEHRQKKLLEMVKEPYQCVITATEFPAFLQHQGLNEYLIEKGNVTKIGGTEGNE